jgi:hypothetical protein
MLKGGRCLCGAVRFTAELVSTGFHACHCGMCRRWAGGPFMAVRASGVQVTGDESPVRYRSSEWAERAFCGICGTHLFYHLLPAEQYFVAVGSLDDSTALSFAQEIYIDQKSAEYAFAGERERFTEAEVIARFSAAQ